MIRSLIKEARVAKGMSTRQLADEAEITQSMVSRYESGRAVPSRAVLMKLSNVLEVDFQAKLTHAAKAVVVVNNPVNEQEINKDFEKKVSRARGLSPYEKRVITEVIASFLRVKDMQKKVANFSKELVS